MIPLDKVANLEDLYEIYADVGNRLKLIYKSLADDYADVSFPVTLGTLCVHDGALYKANQAIQDDSEWTPAHWTSTDISELIGAISVPVTDVQINSSSILQNGIANIPLASYSNPGVVKIGSNVNGLEMNSAQLNVYGARASDIQTGNSKRLPITPYYLPDAIYHGFARAAGYILPTTSHPNGQYITAIGTYNANAKNAIQTFIGVDTAITAAKNAVLSNFGSIESDAISDNPYAIGETFVYDGKRYRATAAIALGDVIAPGTNCELDPLNGDFVKKTDIASSLEFGVVKVKPGGGTNVDSVDHTLIINKATDSWIKAGANLYAPIVPASQHASIFYGLSKLAGVDLANETVTVGTYPTTSKTAILAMLGAVGTADVGNGLRILNGQLTTDGASAASIKNGTNVYAPLTSNRIHEAVYYGLAKLASADMASVSGETVGVYPQAQKTAIQTMLGIEADIPLIETVSGTTPSITGMPNVRYICETAISELTITPPASGSIVVRFVAGSNCIVSLPQTVKLPEWFDISSLTAGTTYEIIITDGVYGGVMSWAA